LSIRIFITSRIISHWPASNENCTVTQAAGGFSLENLISLGQKQLNILAPGFELWQPAVAYDIPFAGHLNTVHSRI